MMRANCSTIPITSLHSHFRAARENRTSVTLSRWTPWGRPKAVEKVTAMEHTGFPSDETLAAFIDGRLDAETRAKVIAHMTTCSECYSVFLSATELPSRAAARDSWRPRRAWIAVGAATAAAAIACVFLVTPLRERIPHRENGMEALAKAAPAHRTIAGRISVFPYQPRAPVMRGSKFDALQNPATASLLTAAARVERPAAARRTAANLHASGVANLLLGKDDIAINRLHE